MDFGDDDFCLNITQSSGKPAKSAVPKATAESSSVGRPEKKKLLLRRPPANSTNGSANSRPDRKRDASARPSSSVVPVTGRQG